MVPGGQAAGGYLASSRSPRARISGARCPRRAAGSSSPRAAARPRRPPRAALRSAPPAAAAVPGERRVPEPRLPQAAESCDGANAAAAADGGTGTPRAGDGGVDGSAPATAAGAAPSSSPLRSPGPPPRATALPTSERLSPDAPRAVGRIPARGKLWAKEPRGEREPGASGDRGRWGP